MNRSVFRRLLAQLGRVRESAAAVAGRKRSPLAISVAAATSVILVGTFFGYMARDPQGALRTLPGVAAFVPLEAPNYDSSFFGLRAPLSVAVSSDGRLMYVAEGTGDRVVRVIDIASGESIASLAPPLTTPGLRKPISVATMPNGRIYVVDRIRRAVDIYDEESRWIGNLLAPISEDLWNPLSVDADPSGEAYVTNTGKEGPVLTVYGSDGTVRQTFGSISADGVPLSFPNSVARADSGDFVIGDSNNSRIVVLDPVTGTTRSHGNIAPNALAIPRGVAIDQNGLSLVVDANDHTVSAWDFEDNPPRMFDFGEPGIGDGAFLFPNDIAVGPDGHIYIADRDNDRVQVWRY